LVTPSEGGAGFIAGRQYTATITLTANSGWKFDAPLPADFFFFVKSVGSLDNTARQATVVTGNDRTVTVTVTFPSVGSSGPDILIIKDGRVLSNFSFESPAEGYTDVSKAVELEVYNTLTSALSLTVAVSGTSFQVSPASLSLPAEGRQIITVGPVAGLAAGSYSGTLTISGGNISTVNLPLSINVAGVMYTINHAPKPGTDEPDLSNLRSYAAKRGSSATPLSVGTISDVLSAIREDAKGSLAVIQFGPGDKNDNKEIDPDEVVSFESHIAFEDDVDNIGGVKTSWGDVEIQGNILSKNNDGQFGAVVVGENVSLTSFANIESQGSGNSNVIFSKADKDKGGSVSIKGGTLLAKSGRVIYNSASGKVVVSGGTVRTLVTDAILNDADGDIEIDGGSVEAQVGRAIQNSYIGTVTVTNGVVRAWGSNGVAIRNAVASNESNLAGKIFVKGGTVTSENTIPDQGTIVFSIYNVSPVGEEADNLATLLTITGGKVENTIIAGNAIYNDTTGRIVIENGKVEELKSNGIAIFNKKNAPLDIKGGEVTAVEGTAIYNTKDGVITISGGIVKSGTGRAIWSIAPARGSVVEENVVEERFATINVIENGKVISGNPSDTQGTIHINTNGTADGPDASIIYTYIHLVVSGNALVENTSSIRGNAVCNDSADNVIVEGGEVKALGGYAIDNLKANGQVIISGGKVTVTDGRAVNNRKKVSPGVATPANYNNYSVTISGGEVSAVDGIAVYNVEDGDVHIKGVDTIVTSKNSKSSQGTIVLEAYTAGAGVRLLIEGGKVENTFEGNVLSGNAIYNASTGQITITGFNDDESEDPASYPLVTVTSGVAVYNFNNAILLIRDGATVEATGKGYAVYNKAFSALVTITDAVAEEEMPEGEYFADEQHRTVVRAVSGSAVYNEGAGPVTISGGTVSVEDGYAVNKAGTGVINITSKRTSDGDSRTRIFATEPKGVAINNNGKVVDASAAEVVISGKTLVSSKNTTLNQGTIIITDIQGNNSVPRLVVNGGKVVNEGGGIAIINRSRDQVTIEGGIAVTPPASLNAGLSVPATIPSNTVEVLSDNRKETEGTIVLGKVAVTANTEMPLLVYAGNVYNSAVGGNAIYNASLATVRIGDKSVTARRKLVVISEDDEDNPYGGGIWVHVDKEGAIAVNNLDNGIIDIQGGTVEATGPSSNKAVYNAAGGQVKIDSFGLNTTTDGTLVQVTGSSSYAVWNSSERTVINVAPDDTSRKDSVIIKGGKVLGTTSITVFNNAKGTILINTGTAAATTSESTYNPIISATTGVAVQNNGEGSITIKGGLIKGGEVEGEDEDASEAKPGTAIYNVSFGTIDIKVAAADILKITSRNPVTTEGTIYFSSTQGDRKSTLNIESAASPATGFVIDNTAAEGNVILQESHGNINIATETTAFAGTIGAGKRGLSSSYAPEEGVGRGYALKVTNQSARGYVRIGSALPKPFESVTFITTYIIPKTNIGVVKGTCYSDFVDTTSGGIEEP